MPIEFSQFSIFPDPKNATRWAFEGLAQHKHLGVVGGFRSVLEAKKAFDRAKRRPAADVVTEPCTKQEASMSEAQPAPKGVVAILTGPDGHVWANVCDFDQSGLGAGFTVREAQEYRAKRALQRTFIHNTCSDVVAAAIDDYIADQVFRRLKGFKTTIVPVGHGEAE